MSMNKRTNKYLFGTILIFVSMAGLLSILTHKYLPFIFHTTIYYCQEFIKSFNFRVLPDNSNLVILVPVFLILTFVGGRIILTVVQLLLITRGLNRHNLPDLPHSLVKLTKKFHLTEKVEVITNHNPLAMCFGIFNPKIYLSTKLLEIVTNKELEVILRHERHHLEHKDNLTMFFAQIIQTTFPFIPVLSDLVKNFRVEREIVADEYASQEGHCAFVVSSLKKLLAHPQKTYAFIASLASADTLEARIKALSLGQQHKYFYSWKNICISAFSVFVLLTLALTPVQAIEVQYQGKDIMMICPNDNECLNACKQAYSMKKKNYSENQLYIYTNYTNAMNKFFKKK